MTGPNGIGSAALFLDFDGTLVEIAERPEAVRVPPDLPAVLRDLARALGGALAIVTGRSLADVSGFLPGLPVDVCGLHGLERRVGGALRGPEGLRELGPEIAALRLRFREVPGVVIEDKGVGVAVHWRLAPDAEGPVLSAMAELAAALGPAVKIQDGKMVREILPARAGKGEGIRDLMEALPYRGRLPVFAGDDRTDEHGFEAVNRMGGLSVKIGPGPTAALRRVPSVEAFRQVLAAWSAGDFRPDALPPS